MPVITIPKALRDKLGDHASDALGDLVKEIDLDARKDALALAEERLEKKLAIEIGKVNEKIAALEGRLNEKIAALEGRLNEKIAAIHERITLESGRLSEQLASLKGEMNLIKAEIRFLVILTIIAITLMNPVAAEIIKKLLKL